MPVAHSVESTAVQRAVLTAASTVLQMALRRVANWVGHSAVMTAAKWAALTVLRLEQKKAECSAAYLVGCWVSWQASDLAARRAGLTVVLKVGRRVVSTADCWVSTQVALLVASMADQKAVSKAAKRDHR